MWSGSMQGVEAGTAAVVTSWSGTELNCKRNLITVTARNKPDIIRKYMEDIIINIIN